MKQLFLSTSLFKSRKFRFSTVRVTDTVAWFLDNLKMPSPSSNDLLLAAIYDLKTALSRATTCHPSLLHSSQLHHIPTITEQLTDLAGMYDTIIPHVTHSNQLPTLYEVVQQRVLATPCSAIPTNEPSPQILDLPTPPTVNVQRVPAADNIQHEECPASNLSPLQSPPHDVYPDNIIITSPTARLPSVPKQPTDRRITRQHTANQHALAHTALNLAQDGSPLTYSKAKAGPDSALWLQAEAEEFDRLFLSQTMQPIHYHAQPANRRGDTTYFNPQTKQKITSAGDTTYRIRGTAGGDRINYTGPTSVQTVAMPVVKLFLHSVVSEHKNWMTIDIKDYYLGTLLLRPEYIRIPLRMIPKTTQTKHNLLQYVHRDTILFQINKGMYGLPQAGLLAQQRLLAHLQLHGYHETSTPCLFRHSTNGTDFTLVVDDFGVKYATRQGAMHLISTLQLLYTITVNWEGSTYIGFTINFDTVAHTVTLTMPGYIDKVLQRFASHIETGAPTPAIYIPPSYSSTDHTVKHDLSRPLNPAEIKTL